MQKKEKGIHRLYYKSDHMLTLQQIQEKKDITQLYTTIHEIIFQKLKIIPLIVVSIVLLSLIIQDHTIQQITIDPVIQSKIIATFTKQKTITNNVPDMMILLR